MTDRLPSVDAESLLERYDRLVTILSDAAPDEGARAATKSHIIALFRDVERALAELALHKDDVKELVALWKVQPVLDPIPVGAAPGPASAASGGADPGAHVRPDESVPVSALLDPDALEAAVRRLRARRRAFASITSAPRRTSRRRGARSRSARTRKPSARCCGPWSWRRTIARRARCSGGH